MFCQQDVYVPTEYGTRQCREHREPCGAFYGVPFSGEIDSINDYEQQQIQEALPDRWFSERDELVLARLRGEIYELPKPKDNQPSKVGKTAAEIRIYELVEDFRNNTQAPSDAVAEYALLAKKYISGESRLLNNLLDLYQAWMSRRAITRRLCGMRI